MTEAQQEAFTKIEEIAREHFMAAVIVVEGEMEDNKESDIQLTYHGGYSTSIGLLEIAKLKVWERKKDTT